MYTPLNVQVQRAEELARQHDGQLPPYMTLLRVDPRLAGATRRHPKAFAHLQQSKRTKFADRKAMYVQQAEAIAAKNDGVLPVPTDIAYSNKKLAAVVAREPELFAHIPQAERTKSRQKHLEACIKEAEEAAAQNGGALNITQKFQDENPTLTMMIRRNPKAFAHIPRVRRRYHQIEQYVGIAETLAKKNGGKLPPKSKLVTGRYPWLLASIRNHPHLFTHIKRERLNTPFTVRVEQAKALAEKNNGVIPHYSWLQRHGHAAVGNAIYSRRDLFKGLRQEVRDGGGRLIGIRTY
jgi:hypothetical protein